MTKPLGLYIHIPFCEKKCNYCDFFSGCPTRSARKGYIEKLLEEIKKWGTLSARPIDTLYIGGGTPSLLTEDELESIFSAIREAFPIICGAEITCEVNPADDLSVFLSAAKRLGVNRISIGIQSANENELRLLGRRHTFEDAENTVKLAKKLGFDNISVDLMLGLPYSNEEKLKNSINSILALDVDHISAYILKVEEGTPLSKMNLPLPDEDAIADQYLLLCDVLADAGYSHYEISNFARSNKESRHNNKYWALEDYIGIGASAHSFLDGKRFFYAKDLEDFSIIEDGEGGNADEYIMLSLRTQKGLDLSTLESVYGIKTSKKSENILKKLEKNGLTVFSGNSVRLTNKGMLVSNSVIGAIYENI